MGFIFVVSTGNNNNRLTKVKIWEHRVIAKKKSVSAKNTSDRTPAHLNFQLTKKCPIDYLFFLKTAAEMPLSKAVVL